MDWWNGLTALGLPLWLWLKTPDGAYRLCVDLRLVNHASAGSGIRLPNTAELLSSLSGSVCLSTIDMSNWWK